MAPTGYTDVGEEWAQKWAWRQDTLGTRDTTVEILMYDDSTDSLSDSSDIGDITTEPTSGNYARQTDDLDATDVSLSVSGGDLRAQVVVTFDVTNTTETVDAWGAVLDFQSDVVNSETGQNAHLITAATFDGGSKDLSNFTGDFEVTANLDLN